MRATPLLLSLLLAATVTAAELGPFSAVRSKQEAARAFAGVERALQLKVRDLAVLSCLHVGIAGVRGRGVIAERAAQGLGPA